MKKVLAFLLTLTMLCGMVPMTAFPVLAEEVSILATDAFAGKKVSILSHSMSTYAGVSNNTAANSTIGKNDVYYTAGRHGVYQKDTWWQQAIDALGMELLVNNSWSGSCIFQPRKGEASVGYGDRAVNLHNDHTGEEPDIIWVYLGCNDFAYFKDTFGKAADVDYSALITDNSDGTFTYAAPKTACEAYAIMLHKVATRYPNAAIYCMTSTARRDPDYAPDNRPDAGQPTEYSAQLHQIAKKYGYPIVDLEKVIPKEAEIFDQYIGDKRAHANALGMDQITNALLSVMLENDANICHVSCADGTVNEQAVLLGGRYSAEVKQQDGYSVVVSMNGADITAESYRDGTITIENVTGDIVVRSIVRRTPLDFSWNIQSDVLTSVGDTENTATKLSGTITDGLLTNTRYQLETAVVLKHNLPWELEWQFTGDWRGCIFATDPLQKTKGMYYLTRTVGGQLCFGTWSGQQHDNYGVDLSDLDDQTHAYRLVNKVSADGSNMVWLYVDDAEMGAMNHYYVGSKDQAKTSDWISGKDFVFPYIGMDGHALKNCWLNYLNVTECTHTYENGVCTVCGAKPPNPFVGKTIACIGDSITAAYGVTKDKTDYVKLLADRLEMNYIRLGTSGTTLCANGGRVCNIDKLTESKLQGADVVTIAMGINDFCGAGPGYYELGDIHSTDTSTIYGAVRMWCEQIVELRKTDSLSDTQFYFVTPLITSWNNSVTSGKNWDQSKVNIHGYTLRDLCNAIIEVATLYDVAVIDMNLISGLYYVNAQDNNIDVFGGDGVHPGNEGHAMMAAALEDALLKHDLQDDHDHRYGSWIITTYPDCGNGEEKRVCEICRTTESRELAGKGHTYENGVCTGCGATSFVPGDADGNGAVNNRDLGLLQRYLNAWSVTVDTLAADLDADGKLTNRDLALLQRKINEWEATE